MEVRPEAIRQARLDAGLSRAKLAGDELTRGAIYLIETGRSRPSMATLELIAARTGRPLSYFLEPGVAEPPVHLAPLAAEVGELQRHCLAGRYEEADALGASILGRPLEPRWEARAGLWHGIACLHLGRLDEAQRRLDRCLDLFEHVADPWARADCLAWRAQLALTAGDADAAALARQADDDARSLAPVAWPARIRALLVLGRTHAAEEEWDAARASFAAALEAARAEADASRAAGWYEELGAAYRGLGDAATAAECGWKAATLYELREGRELAVAASIGLSRCHLSSGDARAARQQLQSALSDVEGLALRHGEAQILLGLAGIALGEGDREEAGEYAGRALAAADTVGDPVSSGQARTVLGRVAAAAGDREAAIRAFETAIGELVAAGVADELVEARMAYAEALEAWGETAAALAQWKQTMARWRPALGRTLPS